MTAPPNSADVSDGCDLIIERAIEKMARNVGANPDIILNRLLTFAGAHLCLLVGSSEAANLFRQAAIKIEAGHFQILAGGEPAGGLH
ncbi:hypothetical protein [Bosea sp. 2RAB26]|uniref:hypothetical protein n=1 Tax=Bosea sp. 2RAB26 TaxID=3237476 RepID=UPI003F915FFD